MDKLIRAYLLGEIQGMPSIGEFFGDDDRSVGSLMNYSLDHQWAWDALLARVCQLHEGGRHATGPLAVWEHGVVLGKRIPPGERRGPKALDERNHRIEVVLRVLERDGMTQTAAVKAVARELSLSPEAVLSARRKVRHPSLPWSVKKNA